MMKPRLPLAVAAIVVSIPLVSCADPTTTSTPATSIIPGSSPETHLGPLPGQAPPMCPQPGALPALDEKPLPEPTGFEVPHIRGPFTSIGVILQPDHEGGARLVSARIDVVADSGGIPNPVTDRSAAAKLDDQIHAGTEPGLAARRAINDPAPGPFSVSLAALNAALYGKAPANTDATSGEIASPPVAPSYTVYLVMTVDQAPCLSGATEPQLSHPVVIVAKLLR